MDRTRWVALSIAASLLAAGGAAWGTSAGGGRDEQPAALSESSSSTTASTSTTTAAPTTSVSAAPPVSAPAPAPPAVRALQRGDRGEEVAALQRRLAELRLDPGPADGSFGVGTMYAVQAFQKLQGMGVDGKVGPEVAAALVTPVLPQPMIPNGGVDRVEIDLRSQLLFLYKGGELRLVSHVSTGNNKRYCAGGSCRNRAITPVGSFRFLWRYDGWRTSRLGKLYNPVYFTKSGVAIHGSTSVPTYPASHGCVRIPMHIAEYFPSLVQRGDPVYVLDGVTSVGPPTEPEPAEPPPEDPPADGSTTTTTTEPPGEDPPPPTTTPTTVPA